MTVLLLLVVVDLVSHNTLYLSSPHLCLIIVLNRDSLTSKISVFMRTTKCFESLQKLKLSLGS